MYYIILYYIIYYIFIFIYIYIFYRVIESDCRLSTVTVTLSFFFTVALAGCDHAEHPELNTAHGDVLALFPGTSDWPFISSDAVSGPHKSLSFLWEFEAVTNSNTIF